MENVQLWFLRVAASALILSQSAIFFFPALYITREDQHRVTWQTRRYLHSESDFIFKITQQELRISQKISTFESTQLLHLGMALLFKLSECHNDLSIYHSFVSHDS